MTPADEARRSRRITLAGAALGGGFATLAILALTWGLGDYGFAAFVVVPFVAGGLAGGCVARSGAPRLATGAALVLTLVVTGVALLAVGAEGAYCLVMAFPLSATLMLAGACVGDRLVRTRSRRGTLACLAVPVALLGVDATREPAVHAVTTSWDVDASPEVAWRHVVEMSELPPPTEWPFRLGIAYPTGAAIHGSGVGAVRHCRFSTGAFVEPITAWEPPHLLAFDVTSTPAPMRELSFRDVHAPHLDGTWRSHRGEIRLEPLPGGRTRLRGTTWYSHGLAPEWYWRLWSDALVHRVHLRVLRHVAAAAEAAQGQGAGTGRSR